MVTREREQLVDPGMNNLNELKQELDEAMVWGARNGSLVAAKGIQAEINEKMVEIRDQMVPFPAFKLAVNYDLSVMSLVTLGHYDWSTPSLPPSLESATTGLVPTKLFLLNFAKPLFTQQVLSQIQELGLRPASAKELLTLGIDFPDLQRQFPIVALGGLWFDNKRLLLVPSLKKYGLGRALCADMFQTSWPIQWRFAAVRK